MLFDNGQIAAWGHNWYGVDPRSSLSGAAPLFQAYSPPSDWRFRQIACGGHFVAALRDNGEIVCWGMFGYRAPHEGPLVWGPGYRGTMPQSDPAAIPSWYAPYSPPYVRIAAGHVALMGLKADGTLHIWGTNDGECRSKQPRDGGNPNQPDPVKMADVIGGYSQWVIGRREDDGGLVTWGFWGTSQPTGGPIGSLPEHFTLVRGNSNQQQALSRCYDANCDKSTNPPVLSVNDFICFGNAFSTAQSLPYQEQIASYANCDGSTSAPVLTVNDYQCFNLAFVAPCP